MKELARVLFQVSTVDADAVSLTIHFDINPAVVAEGLLVLRNLIALGQIGIIIVFPRKDRVFSNLAIESQTGHDGKFYRLTIDDWQNARHTETDGANVRVGGLAKNAGVTSTEHFGPGLQLHVDFHADDGFVLHGTLLFPQKLGARWTYCNIGPCKVQP